MRTNFQMIWRKGITQTFSADGVLLADERWQILRFANGAARLDAEVTRPAPFAEPRIESFSLEFQAPELTGQTAPSDLTCVTLHESRGRREGRVNVVGNRAYFCWQHGQETHRLEQAWGDDAALEYDSALFATVLVWQSRLMPSQSRAIARASLHPVSFQPSFAPQVLTRLPDEERETRFGMRWMACYALAMPISFPSRGEWDILFWCDEDGVVYELARNDGTRTVLTAVSFR